jgi:hypothetical protein
LSDFLFRQRLDFFGIKKEAMTGLAKQTHVPARILIDDYTDMSLSFIVLFDALDGGNLPSQRDIHHISAFPGTQAHPASRAHFNA